MLHENHITPSLIYKILKKPKTNKESRWREGGETKGYKIKNQKNWERKNKHVYKHTIVRDLITYQQGTKS